MELPLLGELGSGDHRQRVVALAGALAESGVTRIALETDDAELIELEARETDLPGLLADPSRRVALHVRGRTLISVSPTAIEWITHDPKIHESLLRARTALP